ncbi:MAG: PaaI family thioesterase [Mycobacteriaceae bacterium]
MSSKWTVPAQAELPVRPDNAPAPGERLPVYWAQRFAVPSADAQGLGTKFYAGEGISVRADFDVHDRFEGGPGVIHGGILSCAFDEVQGMLGLIAQIPMVTAHLEIDYSAPIPIGSSLEFRSVMEGVVDRKVYTRAEAYHRGTDRLVASSRALFIRIVPEAHFANAAQQINP